MTSILADIVVQCDAFVPKQHQSSIVPSGYVQEISTNSTAGLYNEDLLSLQPTDRGDRGDTSN